MGRVTLTVEGVSLKYRVESGTAEKPRKGILAAGVERVTACGKNLYMLHNNTRST